MELYIVTTKLGIVGLEIIIVEEFIKEISLYFEIMGFAHNFDGVIIMKKIFYIIDLLVCIFSNWPIIIGRF